MQKELYFDISSAESGGSLFRLKEGGTASSFYYQYSTYDEEKDELKVFESHYPDFAAFWRKLTEDPQWYYLHPLYVHPEQRDFVGEELKKADWGFHPDKKWQESHQRQWKKVLTDPPGYYGSPDLLKVPGPVK